MDMTINDEEYSRVDDLQHKIINLLKNVSPENIQETANSLFLENLIVGKRVFCIAILERTMDSPDSIPALGLLISSINARIPDIGFVILKRIVQELHKASLFMLQILSQLLACLINHRVVYHLLAQQFMLVLLEKPDDDHVEIGVTFLLECGYGLFKYSPSLLNPVIQRLIEIFNTGKIQNISRQAIGGLFMIIRDGFSGFEVESPVLDDQFTHEIPLDYRSDHDSLLDVLKANLYFLENFNHVFQEEGSSL